MKFLLVSPFTNASGSSIRFWNIAETLAKKGHDVILIERIAKGNCQLYQAEKIKYYGCPSCGVLILDILFSLFFYLFILLRNLNFDIYYALKPAPNNCIPAIIAALIGKKIILDIDDLDYAYLNKGIIKKIGEIYFNLLPKFFPLVTYHTPELKKYLLEKTKIKEEKLYYLAQGVSKIFLETDITNVNIKSPFSIIYVATLGITSDFEDLINPLTIFFSKHIEAVLTVVGDGCRKKEFEKEIAKAGISDRVIFTGKIDHRDLPLFIASHRVGINYMRPSLVNNCRAILKIREYLGCGLDVVCNDTGDVNLFKDYIYITSNVNSMLETIEKIFSLPPVKNLRGREFIERNFNWQKIISDFEKRLFSL